MAASDVPASLKAIQPFLRLAKEYENRDPVVVYWIRYYAVQVGIKSKTKENISFLMNQMDLLEKMKQQHGQEEAITNDIVAQAHLEHKGSQLFLKADTEDRAARFNKNVVKLFYSASLIFDILTTFGELNDEIMAQRKYAKWKAAYINNCLKKGETPIPGPVGGDDNEGMSAAPPPPAAIGGGGLPYPTNHIMPDLPPSVVYPPSNLPRPHPGTEQGYTPQPQQQPVIQTNQQPSKPSSTSGVHLQPMDYTKAQKFCKYASSALQYEDVPTAIDNLQKALKLLQTGECSD